jgi:hypothetical protein
LSAQIRLCNHLKANGVWCASPALRGHMYCHFHHEWRETKPNLKSGAKTAAFELPLLEDANAVQVAIQRVMQAILHDEIDNRKAGLLLYALQTAACNLKNTRFEHSDLKDQARDEYADPEFQEDQNCTICAPRDSAEDEQGEEIENESTPEAQSAEPCSDGAPPRSAGPAVGKCGLPSPEPGARSPEPACPEPAVRPSCEPPSSELSEDDLMKLLQSFLEICKDEGPPIRT